MNQIFLNPFIQVAGSSDLKKLFIYFLKISVQPLAVVKWPLVLKHGNQSLVNPVISSNRILNISSPENTDKCKRLFKNRLQ